MAFRVGGLVFLSDEDGLGPEHFIGVEEAAQEIEREAASLTAEQLLNMANESCKRNGQPLVTLEDIKRAMN